MKKMKKCLFGVLVLGMGFGTERIEAANLYVPSPYMTIQAGVDAYPTDSPVSVAAGTYIEAGYINEQDVSDIKADI